MKRRVFDSDLTVQYLHPTELTFPVFARLLLEYFPHELLIKLVYVLDGAPSGYVLLVAFDDAATPMQARVQTPPGEEEIWVPWALCSPDLAVMVN